MIRSITRRAAPLAVLTLGVSLSGCAYVADWDEVDGVAIGELDMGGEAPTALELAGPDSVVITQGEALTITLDGDYEAGEALRFDRDGDELTIARDRSIYDGSSKAIVLITMPSPKTLGIAGSGTIEADSMAQMAEIEIAGSGDIGVAAMEAEELDIEIAGSGSVTAKGTAQELEVSIAGSGDAMLAELSADTVSIEIAGSGDVAVASDGTVAASIAGSGDVVVTGSASCTVSSAGSGSLTCRPPATSADAADESVTAAE